MPDDASPFARIRDAMEAVTSHRPVKCPWRAYYDPIVREVIAVSWSVEGGNLGAVLGADPPAILVDAIGVYRTALESTLHDERKKRDQIREAQRRHG